MEYSGLWPAAVLGVLRKGLKGFLAVAVLGALVGVREAEAVPSDQITLTVTPQAAVNVSIATSSVDWGGDSSVTDSLNVGTLATGTTAYMITPATVTYTGTYNSAEMELSGGITGGMGLSTTLTDAANDIQVFGLFSAVSVSSPTFAQYEATDHMVQTGAAIRVGASGSDNNDGNYLNNSYDSTDNENYAAPGPSDKRLWIMMNMPPSNSFGGTAQNVTVTLTALAAN